MGKVLNTDNPLGRVGLKLQDKKTTGNIILKDKDIKVYIDGKETLSLNSIKNIAESNNADIERYNAVDVEAAANSMNKSESFTELELELDFLSVPDISDSYDKDTNEYTANCKEITPVWASLYTEFTTVDAVILLLADAKAGNGNPSGQVVIHDKYGNQIVEGTNLGGTGNLGKFCLTSAKYIWYYVPKGAYANITAAKADLGTMNVVYQLETPVVTELESYTYDLDLSSGVNFRITNDSIVDKIITISNTPTTVGKIITVSILWDQVLVAGVTFPLEVVWQNDSVPVFTDGRSSIVMLTSYDNGTTWLGSVVGDWDYE